MFWGTACTHPLIVITVIGGNYSTKARPVVDASFKYREIPEALGSGVVGFSWKTNNQGMPPLSCSLFQWEAIFLSTFLKSCQLFPSKIVKGSFGKCNWLLMEEHTEDFVSEHIQRQGGRWGEQLLPPPTFAEFTGSHTSSRRFCVCAVLAVDRPRDPTKWSPHHEYPLSKVYTNTCQILTSHYRSQSLFPVNFSEMTLKSAFTSTLLSTFGIVVRLVFVLFSFLHVSICLHFGIGCPTELLTLLERRPRTFIVIG